MSGFRSGEAIFQGAVVKEGLTMSPSLPSILALKKPAIHRIAYAGMVAEIYGNLHILREIKNANPASVTGQVLQRACISTLDINSLKDAWKLAKEYFCVLMPNQLCTVNPERIRTQMYFDTLHEPDAVAATASQVMRMLILTDPGHYYTPGQKQAKSIERLDPASIYAWYSRQLTSPFHIDDGPAEMNPITKGYVYNIPDAVQPEVSREELTLATRNILEEASTTRINSIPNAAFVEIDVPPLVALCFAEITPELVIMEGIDPDGKSLPIVFQPAMGSYQGPNTGSGPSKQKMDSFEHYVDLVALLGASALRDFWVIEDREAVLGKTRVSRPRGLKANKSRIIYLPRVRYIGERLKPSQLDPMSATERRAHWRSAHFRTLPKGHRPSKKQLMIAAANNQTPPPGQTWIKGTSIEGNDDTISYRSRSAVKALFDTIPFEKQSSSGLSWFAFERLCAHELRRQGFEELTRQGGDRGTDIYCVKESGGETETWVVQCKHWSKKVGPEIVRELHGAQALRGADRSLLITSSAFTLGAIETARELGINLIDIVSLRKSEEI